MSLGGAMRRKTAGELSLARRWRWMIVDGSGVVPRSGAGRLVIKIVNQEFDGSRSHGRAGWHVESASCPGVVVVSKCSSL